MSTRVSVIWDIMDQEFHCRLHLVNVRSVSTSRRCTALPFADEDKKLESGDIPCEVLHPTESRIT